MEKENLLAKCCPCTVSIKRLTPSEIMVWKNVRKPVEMRRRNRWKRGNYTSKRKKKKSEGRERSESRSSLGGDPSKANDSSAVEKNDTISDKIPPMETGSDDTVEANETRDTLIMENGESFPLWKYKRKRSRSLSPTEDSDYIVKRVPGNLITTNLMNKELQITLERLPVNDKSILQELTSNYYENNLETDGEVESILTGDSASLIMDSCDGSNDEKPEDNQEVDEESQRILYPIPGTEQMELDQINEEGSDAESVNLQIKNEASSDEEESEFASNEDRLTDLCLMHEANVVVTRLEDVMDALENNYSVPDIKYLSEKCLEIIRNVKYSWNMSDDTSYCLVMSPDTEESKNPSDLSDESSDESDSEGSEAFNAMRLRVRNNRRRIESDASSNLEDDSSENPSTVPTLSSVPEECNSPKIIDENTDALQETTLNETEQENAEESIAIVLNCTVCHEKFGTSEEQLNHVCSPTEPSKKSSNKSPNKSHKSKKQRLNPKTSSLECTICSHKCESHEQLSEHIFKHTPQEHQDAYRDAKRHSLDSDSCLELLTIESDPRRNGSTEEVNHPGIAVMLDTKKTTVKSPKGKTKKKLVSVAICPCHTDELEPTDLTVQIEMVLYCETCKVLFRRSNCFETHYRKNATCNQNRRKGRLPRLFCSTCRVVLNTLSDMRKHLEKHASINRHGTVSFVCNICRVVFFGVGTVFCTHWFNHDKDPMFIASQHSFPKVCVSDRGRVPVGTQPGEQYLFVAEYVCRSCKQQFSSDGELSNHECKGEEPKQPVASLPQNSKESTPKAKKTASTSSPVQVSADSPGPLQIDEDRDSQSDKVIEEEVPVQNERSVLRPPVKRPPIHKPPIHESPVVSPPLQNRSSSMNIWICDICNDSFPNLRALGDHAPVHFTHSSENLNDPKKKYICTICKHPCGSLKVLGAHWGKHDLMRYTCSVCHDTYFTLSTFSRHIVVLCGKHNPTCRVSYGVKEFCKICQIMYKDVNDLKTHNYLKHSMNENSKAIELPQKSPAAKAPENSNTASSNGLGQKTPNNYGINTYPRMQLAPSQPNVPPTIAVAPTIEQPIPLVLCVQPTNIVEPMEPLNNYIINIAVPNSAQTPKPDKVITAVSPQRVRVLEDPTVQVVVAQPNLMGSASASLVTNPSPIKTVEVSTNASTFTLTVRDTTAGGGEVVTNTPTVIPESIISTSEPNSVIAMLQQNLPTVANADLPSVNSVAIEELNENDSTSSSDDIQIIELPQNPKEAKEKSPVKINSASKTPRISSDSDIEILSEVTVFEETSKASNEKTPEVDKTGVTDESSEGSGEPTLVANPLCKPQGFLRVKNLAELRDDTNQCSSASGNERSVNTLTQHLLASLETLKNPEQDPASEAPVEGTNASPVEGTNASPVDGTNASPVDGTPVPEAGYMPGKRTLPYIPQRIIGKDVRRANPLPSRPDQTIISKPMNRVTPIPTSNNPNGVMNQMLNASSLQEQLPNPVVNSQIVRPTRYTCPMCPQCRYDTLDKFIRHLYLHPNMPPNVQELVRYLMNRTNPQRVYQKSPQIPPKVQPQQNPEFQEQVQNQPQLQIQPQAQLNNPANSNLLSQNQYKCLICSAYETDSPTELQKHLTTHSQQVVNSQIPYTSFNPQMTYFNSFQSGLNQMYEQPYPYQMANIQDQPATQQFSTIPPQAYSCNLCGNHQLPSYEDFQKHLQLVHNITLNSSERTVCLNCPQVTIFPNEQRLKHHEDTQHSFICNICLQRFDTEFDLSTHCSLHHQNGQYNTFYSNQTG